MTTSTLTTTQPADLIPFDLLADFGAYLRLHVADGDASPHTIRSYLTNARQYAGWCTENKIKPARATETDLLTYRQHLAQHYGRGTVAVKLAAVRRLYQAAVWRGARLDNPAAGLKAPKDKTERSERVKFLPLEGLRRLLDAPMGNEPGAIRDRAMLAMMGRHGLRVSEVSALTVDSLDLDAGTVRVVGKGSKERTVYLTESSTASIQAWQSIRADVANEGEQSLFVALDRRTRGSDMTARAIRWQVDKYLTALDLKSQGVSCHSLRHSAATWARAGGAKIDAIAGMLGHADVNTTRIYSQIVDRMQENPARYLDAMLA